MVCTVAAVCVCSGAAACLCACASGAGTDWRWLLCLSASYTSWRAYCFFSDFFGWLSALSFPYYAVRAGHGSIAGFYGCFCCKGKQIVLSEHHVGKAWCHFSSCTTGLFVGFYAGWFYIRCRSAKTTCVKKCNLVFFLYGWSSAWKVKLWRERVDSCPIQGGCFAIVFSCGRFHVFFLDYLVILRLLTEGLCVVSPCLN